jgi:hypothetical protein
MLFGRKILFSAITILSIVGYGVFVFAIGSVPGQDIPFTPGQELNPQCSPTDPFCKVSLSPLLTHLTGGAIAEYDQGDTILGGIPIKGIGNVYSSDPSYILGEIFGDFTGVGEASKSLLLGYQKFGPGAHSVLNIGRDDISDETNFSIETSSDAGYSSKIYLSSNLTGTGIQFFFGGNNFYNFPSVAPYPGQVLGYVSNNQLGWVTGGGGGGSYISLS